MPTMKNDSMCAHLDLQAGLEADAIWDGGLELCNGVILFFHLGWDGRLRQVEASRLTGLHTGLTESWWNEGTRVYNITTDRVLGSLTSF